MVARISLFFLLLLALPFLILSNYVYHEFRSNVFPEAIKREQPLFQNTPNQFFDSDYFKIINEIELEYRQTRKAWDYIFLTLAIFGVLFVISIYNLNKIFLSNEALIFQFGLGLGMLRFWRIREIVPLKNITNLKAITTTPLIPVKKEISELNWRDKIIIEYRTTTNEPKQLTIPLYIWPRFRKIIPEIIKKRSDLKMVFDKVSLSENFRDTLRI
ncbi:hypothetical protein A3D78_06985 [Candidatus Gottesmanbacteria bacterium RIFCSPHIGHO2_02_FULL_39_14]|uniref:Uncharacterized protein n=1 Tax=Candidatus Gottesmanbacteria bacterium RIFCSPHIGHO2_02_FULL_39_14 TaxID=1798383 RepID=A0A1F5ZTU3_9BACT|nr:MAG: hypothetical protein A3D78_06985 [Candidatus Gottesmanbacteria bacterium RIFCSPHIGHO2_02_FULL_39_14]